MPIGLSFADSKNALPKEEIHQAMSAQFGGNETNHMREAEKNILALPLWINYKHVDRLN